MMTSAIPDAAPPTAANPLAQPLTPEQPTPTNASGPQATPDNGKGADSVAAPSSLVAGGLRNEKNKTRTSGTTLVTLPKHRGTGFENYFCDPPLSPEEAAEEKEVIYHPDRPFHERIEECLQRYRARRRLDSERAIYFNKWLSLGGIDCNQRQFQGLASFETECLSNDEKRQLASVDTIQHGSGSAEEKFYTPGSPYWEVDFPGVVAGFLSETITLQTGNDCKAMGRAIAVVENFLKYVLHHDVCPEYVGQVNEALAICKKAKFELPLSIECLPRFPGEFNLAARDLFCKDKSEFWPMPNGFSRPEGFHAANVFKAGVLLLGTPDQTQQVLADKDIYVVDEYYCHLQVVGVHRPKMELAKIFQSIQYPEEGSPKPFRNAPLGRAVLKPCRIEDGRDYTDLWNSPSYPQTKEPFILDDDILARMRPGFKLAATVCELNIGLKFIKDIKRVLASFHEFLPQELMILFKEPRPNDRPAPTAQAPDVEERELEKQLEREV